MIPAHAQPITALAFSPDGKYLVSYSCSENRLSFWQTSTGKEQTFLIILKLFPLSLSFSHTLNLQVITAH
jgi:WD40 repeat protein